MSGWGLGYNVIKKEWSKEQLDILGISEKYMPRILKPWDIIGGLTQAMSERPACPKVRRFVPAPATRCSP